MPSIDSMFPSKYIKASDAEENDLLLTIRELTTENIGQGEQAERKPVLYFDEVKKGLVLNKTNATSIASLHGNNTDLWPGKRIALFATEVEFQGKQTMALRVRLKTPKASTSASVELLTMQQAVAQLESVGLDREVLKAHLIEKGYVTPDTGKALYSPERDTPWVLATVQAARTAAQEL